MASNKKEWNNAITATWEDLKMIILGSQSEKQIWYDIIYIWNLKYDTNELIYGRETEAEM